MLPPQVLIVEDERIIALDLRRRLTRLGYAVVAMAGSAAEAIAQPQVHGPDLVLMDIGLPGEMTGLEAAAHLGGTERAYCLCHGVYRCADLGAGEDPCAPPDGSKTV